MRSMGSFVSVDEFYLLATAYLFTGCGKTQLGHTMAVIAQLSRVCSFLSPHQHFTHTFQEMGGAEGKVAYIGEGGTQPTPT